MHYLVTANDRCRRTGCLITLALMVSVSGCQLNPNGSVAWPWQNGGLAGPSPNTWRPPSNPNQPPPGARSPMATTSPVPNGQPGPIIDPNSRLGGLINNPNSRNPFARIGDLMARQNEQTRLSEEQRQALAELTEYQRIQQQMIQDVQIQKRNEQLAKLQQQADLVRRQQEELEGLADMRRRALELDANNRDLHAQLAQTLQQNRLLEDKSRLLQQQLRDTAGELSTAMQSQTTASQKAQQAQAEAQKRVAEIQKQAEDRLRIAEAQSAERIRQMQMRSNQQLQYAQQDASRRYQQATQNAQQQMRAMEATMQRRGGATIRANSSMTRNLTAVSIAGLNVRQDGDVVRVELPVDQLFPPGSATLGGGARGMLDQVAAAIRQSYPRQIVGIEAHTDNRPIQTGQWSSSHQLSAAQATAVFEELTSRHQFGARQLFVLGHGANYPIASNGTPAGQQRNRRVEVVIYPETIDSQQ